MSSNRSKSVLRPRLLFLYLVLITSLAIGAYSFYSLYRERQITNQALDYYANLVMATLPPPTAPPTQEATEADPPPPWQPLADFAKLKETMPDIIAWIKSANTIVDYPVVQTKDNDFYLSYLPNQTWNPSGSIFIDYRNAADFTSKNTLVYGHHLRSGDMFSLLVNYRSQTYYEEHPVFTLHTAHRDYDIVLFAGFLISPAVEVPPLEFANATAFLDYVQKCRERSHFTAPVEVTAEDTLVTLITCDFAIDDGRYILIGKLVVTGELAQAVGE